MEITLEEVKNAIVRSKQNKAVLTDEIPSEMLRNDICIDLLFSVMKCFFSKKVKFPTECCRTIINPIVKPDKD